MKDTNTQIYSRISCLISSKFQIHLFLTYHFRVNTADPVHFTLTPPECHMEIRSGYGTSGNRVTGPVHVGDPLTLLINMRSQWGKKDLENPAFHFSF